MKSIIRPVFSLIIVGAMTITCTTVAQPEKCSACQANRSVKEALAQSIKEAAAAVLAAGGPFVREPELDSLEAEKCGCRTTRDEPNAIIVCEKCGCSRTTRDEFNVTIDNEKCGCSKTRRDELISRLDADPTLTVAACCEVCEQPGSLGCQGIYSARCNTCQQGLIKRRSIAEAAATVLVIAETITDDANQFDDFEDMSRAPREELADPCDPCGPLSVCDINLCRLDEQLRELHCCCASVVRTLECQGKDAQKCCKKLKHKIEEVEELVEKAIHKSAECCTLTEGLLVSIIDESAACCSLTEGLLVSIIDQSAECCSVIEGLLGDPGTSVLDIPTCGDFDIVSVVDGTDADILTWLKSLYVLLYNLNSCICC